MGKILKEQKGKSPSNARESAKKKPNLVSAPSAIQIEKKKTKKERLAEKRQAFLQSSTFISRLRLSHDQNLLSTKCFKILKKLVVIFH